ncbi:MAG: enoyl-CoA hydratase/isomerase family protein [Pirellula sp.]
MTQSILEESPRNGVVVLTFNRPERRNALSIDMMRSMIQRLEQLSETRQARVVILRGAGPVFCAGMDLAEASNPDLVAESAECIAKTLSTLRYSPLVTIAAVHGGAYAGGAGVVAACDMAVGADNLQIAFPEARRGLLPALITDVLQTKVREGDLAELFLVGNPIDAQRAQQIGLLQRLTAPDKVLDVALELAKGVLAGGPQTIIDTKTLLHRAFDAAKPADHHDHSSIQEHLKARNSSEAREGLQAFLEKRPPNWIDP